MDVVVEKVKVELSGGLIFVSSVDLILATKREPHPNTSSIAVVTFQTRKALKNPRCFAH